MKNCPNAETHTMQPVPAGCPEAQVQVNQVPEPSTWMLLLIAFAVAGLVRTARKWHAGLPTLRRHEPRIDKEDILS
jgi:hypothetical protein